MFRLETTGAHADVDLATGGRPGPFVVDGRELLITSDPSGFRWGSYVMAPFAGRLRNGRFTFEGHTWQLPLNQAPHAMHGILYDRTWRRVDDRTIEADLGDPWP